jgi:DNA-binding CsgD family transcriptional regulator
MLTVRMARLVLLMMGGRWLKVARHPADRPFTPRQAEIIGLIATGASDKDVATRLGISVPTVRTHLQRLYRDRGLRNRAEAVAAYVATSLL